MRAKTFILVALLVLASGAGASELFVHVRVTENDRHATNVEINVPFRLIERLAPILADHETCHGDLRIGRDDMDVEELRAKWSRLKNGETLVEDDAVLQLVDGARGAQLYVTDRDNGEVGSMVIPADVIDALLSGEHDQLDFEAAVKALGRHGEGELVAARDDDATVKIWIDRSPEPVE